MAYTLVLHSIDVYKTDRLQKHQRIHSGHIQQGSGQARVQQRRMVEVGAC